MSHKRKAEKYDKSDPFIASDDETTSADRPSKKSKSSFSSARHNGVSLPDMKKDDEGNQYWEISKARRVTISDFKGKSLVSIREYYEKDGKQLPGKKGISMTIEQYSAFLSVLPEIEEVLSATGENVPRPKYAGGPVKADNSGSRANDEGDSGDKKPNFEATSDEDED